MSRKIISSTLSALLLGAPAVSSAALTHIGAAAAVKGIPKAQSLGEPVGHVIQSGKPLFLHDHVTTDASSRLQVLLKDETVFTLGPNSDMVLDEWDYNPAAEKGRVTATITKGVFRFVTGKIANNQPSNMRVKLAKVGTIGIRGTIVAGLATPTMCAVMLAGPGAGNNANAKTGAFELSNAMGSTLVKESGNGSMIAGPGQRPTPSGPLPQAVVGQINAGLAAAPTSDTSEEAGAGSGSSSGSSSTEPSAAEESGDSTAAGGETAAETSVSTELNSTAATSSTLGSQDNTKIGAGVADGLATWDQVKGLSSPSGWFFGQRLVNCASCALGSSTEASFQLFFDFGNKQLGGGSGGPHGGGTSFIHLHGVHTSVDTVQSTISSFFYSGQTGNATFTPSLATATGGQPGDTFSGTTISLQNRGGVVAAEAIADMQFNSPSTSRSTSGPVTATR